MKRHLTGLIIFIYTILTFNLVVIGEVFLPGMQPEEAGIEFAKFQQCKMCHSVTAARKTGSRPACDIILLCHEKKGSASLLSVFEWHSLHWATLANSIPPSSGCMPGRKTSPTAIKLNVRMP